MTLNIIQKYTLIKNTANDNVCKNMLWWDIINAKPFTFDVI